MSVDPAKVAALIAEAAAEEVAPRFGRLAPEDVREKNPNDLVTVADEAMEARLAHELPLLLPGSAVVGEEGTSGDPSRLDALDSQDWVWVIDPVDGTGNFARGQPMVAVIVALVHRGETVAGWIHDPLAGGTAMAELGGGARFEGSQLQVASATCLPAMSGSLNAGTLRGMRRAEIDRLGRRFAGNHRLFCAGQEYLRLAGGALHFALFTRLLPWDHAAGVLIHAEAGGWSAKLDGTPYRPTDRLGELLLAPDQATWEALNEFLRPENAGVSR